MEAQTSLPSLLETASERIEKAKDIKELTQARLEIFGKKGFLSLATLAISNLPKEKRAERGRLINKIKDELLGVIRKKEKSLALSAPSLKEVDLTIPVPATIGGTHPIEQFKEEIYDIFRYLGFSVFDAPHIEEDKYNFELLNIPDNHPSRDMWDTLFLDTGNLKAAPGSLLLRTHTSNIQVRALRKYKPPLKVMLFDRCYRFENIDARHGHTFSQFDAIAVGKSVTMANLKGTVDFFIKKIFGHSATSRFRPKYYPFVEPGVGVDMSCVFCGGKGCSICGGTGWFEIAGAGMVHPKVLENGGVDPKEYSGFAFGFGPDRMLMLRRGINDIRVLYDNDLRFLRQYR